MAHLSNTLVMLTRFGEALEQAQKTLAFAQEQGNLKYEAEILTWAIPTCHLRNGDIDSATAALERGMEIALRIGDRGSEAIGAWMQGRIAMERGYLEDALGLFRRTQAAADATGVPSMRALGSCVVGTCYLNIGGELIDKALEYHEKTLEIMEQPTGATYGAQLWSEIGHCVLAAGRVGDADELFHRALAEKTTFMYVSRPSSLIGKIKVALLKGEIDEARMVLSELEQYVGERGMRDWLPKVLLTAATVNTSSNDHSAALENLAQCHDIAAASGMRKVLLDVHRARAQILSAQGKQDEAESARAAARDVGAAIAADMSTESLRTAFTNEAAKHLS